MSTNNGGPAFPVECNWYDSGPVGVQTGPNSGWATGMTLRDHFAGIAMNAAIINEGIGDAIAEAFNKGKSEEGFALIGKVAYQLADAMIAARETK